MPLSSCLFYCQSLMDYISRKETNYIYNQKWTFNTQNSIIPIYQLLLAVPFSLNYPLTHACGMALWMGGPPLSSTLNDVS